MVLLRRDFLSLAAVSAVVPMSHVARAQAYPSRPVRLIIPFPPGGSYDAIGRPLAEKMRSLLGTIVVENQGGASGTLAAASVARAPADGYTVLLAGTGSLGLYAITTSRPMYDPLKDLEPITVVAVTCYAIAVHPSVPVQNLQDLIAYAKAHPGKLTYGSAGVGSLNHLAGELLKSLTGNPDIVHVPYRGAGPAITDALSGQVPVVVPAMNGQVIEFHRTGKLRVLAVANPERLLGAPEIPTGIEAGVPGWITQNVITLVVPAGTPKAIAETLGAATRASLGDQNLQQQFVTAGFEPPRDRSPESARQRVQEEIQRWTPIVKSIGLKTD